MGTEAKRRPDIAAKRTVNCNESVSETTISQLSSSSGFDYSEHTFDGCQDWSDFIKDAPLRSEISGSTCRYFKVRVAQCEGECLEGNEWDCDEEASGFNGFSRYTLKCLKRSLSAEAMNAEARGLEIEAKLLLNMAHPNIVRLRGISAAFSDPEKCNFFVLYDPLQSTLEDMLKAWRKHPVLSQMKAPVFLRPRSNELHRKIKSSLHRRIQLVAFGITQVMTYIHSKGVAMRNLKPATIGFDSHGVVKLYDFSEASPPGSFQRRGVNNAKHSIWTQPTREQLALDPGFETDVYAFGLVLWQVATLKELPERPNSNSKKSNKQNKGLYPSDLAYDFVGRCPSHYEIPSKRVRNIISSCWESNPCYRPSFPRLKMMLVDCYGSVKSTVQPIRRLSSSKAKKGKSSFLSTPTGVVKEASSFHA